MMEALIIGLAILIVVVAIIPFSILDDTTPIQKITLPMLSVTIFFLGLVFGLIPFFMFLSYLGNEDYANKIKKIENRYNRH